MKSDLGFGSVAWWRWPHIILVNVAVVPVILFVGQPLCLLALSFNSSSTQIELSHLHIKCIMCKEVFEKLKWQIYIAVCHHQSISRPLYYEADCWRLMEVGLFHGASGSPAFPTTILVIRGNFRPQTKTATSLPVPATWFAVSKREWASCLGMSHASSSCPYLYSEVNSDLQIWNPAHQPLNLLSSLM